MNKTKQNQPDIPVYLFTGFLESGKTSFIQETLEDRSFDNGEKTLLLVCEEGEEDYCPEKFAGNNIFMRSVDSIDGLKPEYFEKLYSEIKFERVLIEYNGMWLIDPLYAAFPDNFLVYQEITMFDTETFITYNSNMRQLVYDKLKSTQFVVFNRFEDNDDIMPYHRIVRAANRQCDIAYEYKDGKIQADDIEDPLPFDKSAEVIEISERDYALWYSDVGENMKDYDGKTVSMLAQVQLDGSFPSGTAVIGRPLMNCCAADTQFAGLVALRCNKEVKNGDWVKYSGKIDIRRHPLYEKEGPVITVESCEITEAPENPVATFY